MTSASSEAAPSWAIATSRSSSSAFARSGCRSANNWTDAPHGKIQKFDVVVAKNHLTESELAQLSRLVNAYLDVAEDMALRKMPMPMQDRLFEGAFDRVVVETRRIEAASTKRKKP